MNDEEFCRSVRIEHPRYLFADILEPKRNRSRRPAWISQDMLTAFAVSMVAMTLMWFFLCWLGGRP